MKSKNEKWGKNYADWPGAWTAESKKGIPCGEVGVVRVKVRFELNSSTRVEKKQRKSDTSERKKKVGQREIPKGSRCDLEVLINTSTKKKRRKPAEKCEKKMQKKNKSENASVQKCSDVCDV